MSEADLAVEKGPCVHRFEPSDKPNYERCERCGSYRSTSAPVGDYIYTRDYWTHERGHSTLDEQVGNITQHKERGLTKWEFIRRLIWSARHAALDIGCAPGTVLGLLQNELGFEWVCGIEAIHAIRDDLQRIAAAPCVTIVSGFFPECTRAYGPNRFDLVLGLDVFEHSHRPGPFLLECQRILKPGAQLLLMAPMVTDAYPVPDRMFNSEEHVWIHSVDNFARLLWSAGFYDLKFDAWCAGHETVSAVRGERPMGELVA